MLIVAVPTVPDPYENEPANELATVGADNVKAESPAALVIFANDERDGSPLATVNVCVNWVAAS